ncbi:retroviral-like aspartic protease family protein [Kovacikia minuta CCNUW1]|uniref:retroviral-like aspartic protease family protein n=1 Tax=Kovacikia minuta TaxID=2931930 RepID=UPI001CCA2B77|nr:retroviral-like aspartic protease family protein [Kovacikia minuta]UBF23831.1 retroviral-like aspartic protease family protein [Kovacikia minuta CCNUW1]
MGITYAELELVNSDDLALVARGYLSEDQVRKLKVSALVDSGASMLSIPQSICNQLGLRILGEGDAELADGSIVQLDVAGPIEVRFQNRRTTVEALVVANETDVLLGAIPMGGMDVLLDPKKHQLFVNPKSPGKARLFLK